MSRHRLHRSDGAALIEAAIALPLVLLLIMGVVDFGRYVAASSAVNTASRNAARYGSSVGVTGGGIPRYTDCNGIIGAGEGIDGTVELDASHFLVQYDNGPGTAPFAACPWGGPSPDPALIADGDRVVVTVSREFDFIVPLVGSFFGGPLTVQSVDRRTIKSP